ncbi:hypothetical protein ACIOWK_33830 [Pseudomonas protegens]|uniref:hypothetical protein n=1 Tax=Pseudomonas protegens TaxID=380021 RepID=UPI0037FA5BBB
MVKFTPELLDGYTYMLDGDRTVDSSVQELKEAFSPQAIFDSAERRLIKLNPGTTQDLHAYIGVGHNQFGADARAVAFKMLVTDTGQNVANALLCAEGYFIATTCKGLDLVIAMDNISKDVYLAGELFTKGWPRRNGTFTLFTKLIVHPDLRTPELHDLMLELEGVICLLSPDIPTPSSGLMLVFNQESEPTNILLENCSICTVVEQRDPLRLFSIPTESFFNRPSPRCTGERVCEFHFDACA